MVSWQEQSSERTGSVELTAATRQDDENGDLEANSRSTQEEEGYKNPPVNRGDREQQEDTTAEPESAASRVDQVVQASTTSPSISTSTLAGTVDSESDTMFYSTHSHSPGLEPSKATLLPLDHDEEIGQPDLIHIPLGALKPRGRPDKRIGGPPTGAKGSTPNSRSSTPGSTASKATATKVDPRKVVQAGSAADKSKKK